MRKYRWALLKALEFLNSRMPDFEIRAPFIHQLAAYENRLIARRLEPKTSSWTEVYDKTTNCFENEELMLRNTYLNSQMGSIVDFALDQLPDKTTKLRWADELKEPLTAVMEEDNDVEEETSHFGKRKSAVVYLTRTQDNTENIAMTKSKSAKELTENLFDQELAFKPHVTQIINQTNINNFIISSPSVLEFIEFSPKAQFIPKLNPTALMQFHKPEGVFKQMVTVKKVSGNKSSASHGKVLSTIQESRSSFTRIRLGSKVEPLKGESSEQLYPPEKITRKSKGSTKKRPSTSGSIRSSNEVGTIKSISIVSIKKSNKRNENTKQLTRTEPVIPQRFSSKKRTADKY